MKETHISKKRGQEKAERGTSISYKWPLFWKVTCHPASPVHKSCTVISTNVSVIVIAEKESLVGWENNAVKMNFLSIIAISAPILMTDDFYSNLHAFESAMFWFYL